MLISTDRLNDARSASSGTAFIGRVVTAVFSVEQLFLHSYSGQAARTPNENTKRKLPLDKKLRDEIIAAGRNYYPNDKKYLTAQIGRAFGNKLSALDDLFERIRNPIGNNKINIYDKDFLREIKLTEMDMIYFKDIDRYVANPELFDALEDIVKEHFEKSN